MEACLVTQGKYVSISNALMLTGQVLKVRILDIILL